MSVAALFRSTALALFFAAAGANAQAPAAGTAPAAAFQPQSGQAGKDVIWVPTPQALVDKMLDMAKVTPSDFVMDLGSGDGRTVITAAKRGARAMGVEYNPDMVELSKRNAAKEGVSAKATFVKADLFETDFSKATVITMFLLPTINLKLRPKILDLKPGTCIVSNSFNMDTWQPDETAVLGAESDCTSFCTAYFWLVPAKVAGSHKTAQGDLVLKQTFQMLSGTLTSGGVSIPVEGKVRGEEIILAGGGREYRGRLNGKTLELR